MKEVYEFLKSSKTYYLATVDGNQARVRPFGTIHIFEDKLYIQTGKIKDISRQLHANPNVELCSMNDGKWIRVAALAVEDDRLEAQESMLEAYPNLRVKYAAGDGNTEVWYLKNATATISAFGSTPVTITF